MDGQVSAILGSLLNSRPPSLPTSQSIDPLGPGPLIGGMKRDSEPVAGSVEHSLVGHSLPVAEHRAEPQQSPPRRQLVAHRWNTYDEHPVTHLLGDGQASGATSGNQDRDVRDGAVRD